MHGCLQSVKNLTVIGLLLLNQCPVATADDASTTQSPQVEPIDFIDNVRPQSDPANRRATVANPTGWGYATFSPDNKLVATVSVSDGDDSNGEVMFWNVTDPKPGIRFRQAGRILVVAFSPDGKWLAIGPDAPHFGVKLIEVKTGELGPILPGPAARTNAMVWSPDGMQLVLGSTTDKTIRIWNVADKKFARAFEPEASSLLAVGFTKSGRLLAAGVPNNDRNVLAIFDVIKAKTEQTLAGHKEVVEAAAFSGDTATLTSVGWDATVRMWNVASGDEDGAIKGHKKGIRSVATSADGRRFATSNDRELKLWNGEKKELLADLGGENTGAKFVAMSPDGTWLVSISRDGIAHLWDVEKRTEKATLERSPVSTNANESPESLTTRPSTTSTSDSSEPEAVQSLAYSRDGKWIALAREDGVVSIRRAGDGKVARELEAFSDVAACVAFSHDSQRIAAGSFDKSVKVWNVNNGELVAEMTGHTNWVFSVAFSPDGSTLASGGYDKTIKLWNVADSKPIATLSGHTAGVRSVAFTIDGQRLISGSADLTAIVWDVMDRQPIATLKGHSAAVRAVACSPDGKTIATASEDSTVKLWKTTDWTERASLSGTDGVMFWCVAFSPAGRTLAAGAFDGTVKLYDPNNGKERKTLRGPSEAITAVAFAPDAHEIIAGSVDKTLRRWKAETGVKIPAAVHQSASEKTSERKLTDTLTAPNAIMLNTQQAVLSLSFSKDGQKLAVGTGGFRVAGAIQLWNLTKREKLWQSEEFRYGIPSVMFSHDEHRIAAGNFADNFLRLIDVENGRQLKEIRGHRAKVTAIAYSTKSPFFATASLDRDVKLWDASTNKEVKTFGGHTDYVYSIAFSTDCKRLLSGSSDRTARLWDIESGQEVARLKGHQGSIQQAVFSRDGSLIATASADGTVRIYDSGSGEFLVTLRGHRNRVESVAFSPNERLIATGSSDRTIRLWDPACGAELLKLTQEGIVRVVVFAPDGKYLASGCDDKTVKLWDVTEFGKGE